MKDNMTPKITTNRTVTSLIVFLVAVMFGGFILGCFHTPVVIPEELFGKYITTHPEYEDQFFELGSGLITLAFAGGKYKYYDVKRVEKKSIENRVLYTVLCANEDQGEEFNFAFFADLKKGGIIQFKNKQHVIWKKQKSAISYKYHSDAQI